MSDLLLSAQTVAQLIEIYKDLEVAYDEVAKKLQFGCEGCPDNCCDSYFLHHTYIEWSYLWQGIEELSPEKRQEVFARAHSYVVEVERAMQQNRRPQIMCPLNENGLCMVYKHRLMVCRTHGVPALMVRPDGKKLEFPGCFRCQEKVGNKQDSPFVDRTSMLQQLARLENELLDNKRHLYPKVKITIAEMVVKGLPSLPSLFCRG